VQRTEIIVVWQYFFKLTGTSGSRQPPKELWAAKNMETLGKYCLAGRGCLEDTESEEEPMQVESTGLGEKGRCRLLI